MINLFKYFWRLARIFVIKLQSIQLSLCSLTLTYLIIFDDRTERFPLCKTSMCVNTVFLQYEEGQFQHTPHKQSSSEHCHFKGFITLSRHWNSLLVLITQDRCHWKVYGSDFYLPVFPSAILSVSIRKFFSVLRKAVSSPCSLHCVLKHPIIFRL